MVNRRTLIKLRMQLGWSQLQLATACGLTDSTICRIENGTRTPSLTVLAAIANALEISIKRLVK